MPNRYIVRFRQLRDDRTTVLIVEDEHGTAWLYSAGIFHFWLAPCERTGQAACERLAARFGGMSRWIRLPEVAPYTVEGLRQLIAEAPTAPLPQQRTFRASGRLRAQSSHHVARHA